LAQCPPQEWLPKNIRLIAHNVFVPFPEAMLGKYDIVHVQLFATVIKDNDPASVVKNLMSLLSEFLSPRFLFGKVSCTEKGTLFD